MVVSCFSAMCEILSPFAGGESEMERRAVPLFALDPHAAPVALDEPLHDREAHPFAFGHLRVEALKELEQAGLGGGRQPDAVVLHPVFVPFPARLAAHLNTGR